MDAILVLMMATQEIVFGRKKKEKHCMTEEIYLTVTLPKILPDIPKCTVPEF